MLRPFWNFPHLRLGQEKEFCIQAYKPSQLFAKWNQEKQKLGLYAYSM